MHILPLFSLLILVIISRSPSTLAARTKTNDTKISETLKSIDNCVLKSVYSFNIAEFRPPTSIETLESSCKSQTEGFKCVKERSKTLPAILKRGLLTLVQSRQRFHKKYCTNTQSELSKNLIRDFKCIIEKRLPVYQKIESNFERLISELVIKNFNDSSIELKYLCCGIINYRKSIIDNVGQECAFSKASIEEMIISTVPEDTSLLCDDEEKLNAKVCPMLEPIKFPKTYKYVPANGTSINVLYLIATLGEPDETLASN